MGAHDLGFTYEWGDPRSSVISVVSCGIILSLLMSYKKISYRELFNPTSNSVTSLILVPLIPITFIVGGALFWIDDITNLMLIYFPPDKEEYLALIRMMNGGMVSIISVCFAAPLIEEMLFRGVFLRSFLVNYSASSAILLSSLLFTLFHLTMIQLPVAFIMGCLLGWLYVKTRSIWPTILTHFLYNTFAMLQWSTYDYSGANEGFTPEFHSAGIIMAALTSSVAGGILLHRLLSPGAEQLNRE